MNFHENCTPRNEELVAPQQMYCTEESIGVREGFLLEGRKKFALKIKNLP